MRVTIRAGEHLRLRADSRAAPTERDLAAGRQIAEQIAHAAGGRARMAAMVGSRALGTARDRSDLDLLAVIEAPRGQRWGPSDVLKERDRIQAAVGSPVVRTDLWVRTVEQFLAARTVVGGIEHLADLEGVVVYSRPLLNGIALVARPGDVRRENTVFWVRDAAEQLRLGALSSHSGVLGASAMSPANLLRRSVERALMALFVAHQIQASTKNRDVHDVLAELDTLEPDLVSRLRETLGPHTPDSIAAHGVLSAVTERLGKDTHLRERLVSVTGFLREIGTFLQAHPLNRIGETR